MMNATFSLVNCYELPCDGILMLYVGCSPILICVEKGDPLLYCTKKDKILRLGEFRFQVHNHPPWKTMLYQNKTGLVRRRLILNNVFDINLICYFIIQIDSSKKVYQPICN